MDEQLRAQIHAKLQLRETEDLIQIWQERDLHEWEEGTFEIIESILLERLGHLPEQYARKSTEKAPERVERPRQPEQSDKKSAEQALERVEQHWQAEEFEEALHECDLAIQYAPDFARAYYYRALTYEDTGQPELALADYQKALRLDHTFAAARMDMSVLEREFEEKFDESATKQHFDLALDYACTDEPELALQEIKSAQKDMPRIAIAHNYLGLIFQSLGQLEPAIDAYRAAIHLNPHFYPARENLRNANLELEEETYRQGTHEKWDQQPLEMDEVDVSMFDQDPNFEENLAPIPGWVYLDENAYLLTGWPGHRILPSRTGYDPLDSEFEFAHMQGVIIRKLLNNNFRTHNWVYLLFMAFVAGIYCIPLVTAITVVGSGDWKSLLALLYIPYGIVGAALLVNIFSSLCTKKPEEATDSGSAFF